MVSVQNFVTQQLLFYAALFIKECQGWPEGTYGLPMPKSGCPSTKEFEWLTGSRIQQTEAQSHASNPINLAGIESKHTDKIVQNFCMKTSYTRYGNYRWNKGSYCIFKKASCPILFKSGWIYWDDAAPFFSTTIQNYSGTVPDGEYDRNTRIEFCCRNDGPITTDIELPNEAPFYLFRNADGCQKVKNTVVREEWVYWADEDFVNLSGMGGSYPKVHRSRHPVKFTKLYYCYYTPDPVTTKSYKVTMTVIYCIAGILGVFVLVFIITLLISRCQPCCPENNDIGVSEAMMSQPSASTGVSNTMMSGSAGSAVNILRRNGAANRDNELEDYPETSDKQVLPPRYSQVNHRKTPVTPRTAEETIPMVSVLPQEPETRESLPPSYDDVLREKQTAGEDT